MLDFQHILKHYQPAFTSRWPTSARLLGSLLGSVFGQKIFEQFERIHPESEGLPFPAAVLRFFNFQFETNQSELSHIPEQGQVIIVANHPLGSLDGIGLLDAILSIRPDAKIVVNELLMHVERLQPFALPVDNISNQTSLQQLRAIQSHLASGGALIMFPAGEVSRWRLSGIRDGQWNSSFVRLALRYHAPIVPVLVGGRNSRFFYCLSLFIKPLSTAWLIREMFKHRNARISAHIGSPITYPALAEKQEPAQVIADEIKTQVYSLSEACDLPSPPPHPIAKPESRESLEKDLKQCQSLGTTPDGKGLFLTTQTQSPAIVREIARLREATFRPVGEGSGYERDTDQFDLHYDHLFIWSYDDRDIVGAYRLGDAGKLMKQAGVAGLYTHTLFHFSPAMNSYLEHGLELGRSFVQPKYQNRYALEYLWQGIGAFVQEHPHIRYLFGSASISARYGHEDTARIAHFYKTHVNHLPVDVSPRTPFCVSDALEAQLANEMPGNDFQTDLTTVQSALAAQNLTIPLLFKHYSQATSKDGVSFSAFNVDPAFGDCVDAFVIADLTRLLHKKKRRYLGEAWQHRPNKGRSQDAHALPPEASSAATNR
jgi:putative hemolysin